MSRERKTEWFFVGIVVLIGAAILAKTVRFNWYDGNVNVTIVKQKGGIAHLDTRRRAESVKTIPVRTIDFRQGRILANDQYGKLGYSTNFFLDIHSDFRVEKPARYRFDIWSDDGFRLKIDGKTLCEHPGDRPYSRTSCTVPLSKGKHRFELSYFQGGGPMGLKATYGEVSAKRRYLVGENSDLMTFEKAGKGK